MSIRTWGIALALAAAGVALGGCGTSPTAPGKMQSMDQIGVITTLAVVPVFATDGIYNAPVITPLLSARPAFGPMRPLAAISPLNYWRMFASEAADYTWAFADTDLAGRPRLAALTIRRRLIGSFNILKGTAADPTVGDTANIVHKPIDEIWTRHLLFHRLPADSAGSYEWRLAAASGVHVAPLGASTHLVSIRVRSVSGIDTTLSDPAGLWTLPRILRFSPDDSITVTATTTRNDDIAVVHLPDHRFRMTNNGDNTYTFGWHTGNVSGWRHFGVNAFSHGTLYDDAVAYDSVSWIVPYAITSDAPVVYLP